jgi:hypothetical protein
MTVGRTPFAVHFFLTIESYTNMDSSWTSIFHSELRFPIISCTVF